MKAIYKIAMTIVFSGLCLVACDKELKEDTHMDISVETNDHVSFDGKTVTVKKGSPVTFSFNGDPDFISFFSGEIGNEYKYRNRTEMQIEDVTKCEIDFRVWYSYGNATTIKNSTFAMISDQFEGLKKVSVEEDKQAIENCEWVDLIDQNKLPTKANSGGEALAGSATFNHDLTSYLGKKITVALHFNPKANSATMPQPNFMDMQINLSFNNGKTTTILAKDFEFSPLNLVYNLDDLNKNSGHIQKLKTTLGNKDLTLEELKNETYTKQISYLTIDGHIPYFWKVTVPKQILIAGGPANYTMADSWLISAPLLLNGSCEPDKGTSIKNISQSLDVYAYTYEEPGTYTATFVANNANYVHQGGQVVRELTIKVVE